LAPSAAAQSWATTNGYPKEALRQHHEGIATFLVEINEEGRADKCSITVSSGWPELDEATCSEVMKRARFRPATDAQGKPTRGTYSSKVRWVLPR
jgi:protein TonB